jgi:hypothetical protein
LLSVQEGLLISLYFIPSKRTGKVDGSGEHEKEERRKGNRNLIREECIG